MPIDDGQTPFTEKYFGGETARAAHQRLDRQEAALDALVKEVSGMRSEMKDMLKEALVAHEGREALVRVNPDELARKISVELRHAQWVDLIGADLASDAEIERNKRALQEAARAVVKAAPYIFGWKMRILMLAMLALVVIVGGALVDAARARLGM